jgi:hypothetical protein
VALLCIMMLFVLFDLFTRKLSSQNDCRLPLLAFIVYSLPLNVSWIIFK